MFLRRPTNSLGGPFAFRRYLKATVGSTHLEWEGHVSGPTVWSWQQNATSPLHATKSYDTETFKATLTQSIKCIHHADMAVLALYHYVVHYWIIVCILNNRFSQNNVVRETQARWKTLQDGRELMKRSSQKFVVFVSAKSEKKCVIKKMIPRRKRTC